MQQRRSKKSLRGLRVLSPPMTVINLKLPYTLTLDSFLEPPINVDKSKSKSENKSKFLKNLSFRQSPVLSGDEESWPYMRMTTRVRSLTKTFGMTG